jgi:8-oxo-dGTP diphosphatase
VCMNFPYLVNINYILNDRGEVLLQKKARGFGKGNWNGPGGKIKPDEDLKDSAKREVLEETGIIIKDLEQRGEIEFIFPDESINNHMYVFVAKEWEGEPEDKGEGELKWFKISNLPLDKMWDDDQYWLPRLLAGEYIHTRFYFDENNKIKKFEELA